MKEEVDGLELNCERPCQCLCEFIEAIKMTLEFWKLLSSSSVLFSDDYLASVLESGYVD